MPKNKYTGTKETGIGKTIHPSKEEVEKIEKMFSSGDRDMSRLGQKMCHAMRINYYAITRITFRWSQRRIANIILKRMTIGYSLYANNDAGNLFEDKEYLIKLRDGRIIEDGNRHSKTT